ncbi:MAG: DUF1850 domain-containing protein [Chloroflexia bacterium]|nr:DUF1850 domain-containing protein [Chloroflexia bacterium]
MRTPIAFVALLAIAPVATLPTPTIVASDLDTGTAVLCRSAVEGVTLAYTHSMYGGEVREEFGAGAEGRLRRLAMTTANAAAAEYYAYDVGVERVGGRYRVDVPPREFAEVVVRVDRVGAHRLLAGERVVDLVATAGAGHRVALEVRAVPLAARLVPGAC